MVPNFVPLYGVVIVLFSLLYFAFTSVTFLFVRLEIPEVGRLFRGLFNAYFRMVTVTGIVAALAFAASGRPGFTLALASLAAVAMIARPWTLRRIDSRHDACQAGDRMAIQQLRMLHWGGMVANIAVIASVVGSVPYIL